MQRHNQHFFHIGLLLGILPRRYMAILTWSIVELFNVTYVKLVCLLVTYKPALGSVYKVLSCQYLINICKCQGLIYTSHINNKKKNSYLPMLHYFKVQMLCPFTVTWICSVTNVYALFSLLYILGPFSIIDFTYNMLCLLKLQILCPFLVIDSRPF